MKWTVEWAEMVSISRSDTFQFCYLGHIVGNEHNNEKNLYRVL